MPPPDAVAVREQLARILASPLFVNAGRMSRLLRFTVERTLAGEADGLKEYLVGVEVFDRGERYDPRLDSIVRVEARRLRARLTEYYSGPGAADPIVIRYEKGGYAPRFEWRAAEPRGHLALAADAPSPDVNAMSPADAAPPAPARTRGRARTGWLVPAALLVLVTAWLLRAVPAMDVRQTPSSAPVLAVLPLAHFGDDAAEDALADRLTDGIITELGRVPTLQVISRTSVMRFKGTRRPLREVAADLGASVILEGSVLRDEGLVHVKARLVDAATDRKVWANAFQGPPDRLFDLQQQVAQAVAGAMAKRDQKF